MLRLAATELHRTGTAVTPGGQGHAYRVDASKTLCGLPLVGLAFFPGPRWHDRPRDLPVCQECFTKAAA